MGLSPIGTSASIAAQAPSLCRSYPASSVLRASPPSQSARPFSHELPAITAGTSRVAYDPLCVHAVANTPAGLMEFVRSYRSTNFGLPRNRGGSAPALVFSRPAQRSLRLRPACSPGRLRDPLHQRLLQSRRLHCCSDCYRVEPTSSRAGLTPAVDHHLSRRTRSRHLGNQLPHLRQVRLSGTIHPAVFKFGQTQISYWRTISEWEGHRPTAQRYL